MKVPKIKIDPAALRQGIWGNTWRQWGWIMLAFTVLYAVLAGYLTGMLFAGLGIRQDSYRTMSGKWFGPFDRTLFQANMQPLPQTGGSKDPNLFNRPDGCTAMQTTVPLPGVPDVTIQQPTGVLDCSNSDSQWRWTVYPWVAATNGLDNYPGCSNAEGTAGNSASYLSQAPFPLSSPAASDAAVNDGTAAAAQQWVCQNGVPL